MSHRIVVHDYFSSLKETIHDHSRMCRKKDADKSVKLGKNISEFSQEEKNLRPCVYQSDSPNTYRKIVGNTN